MILIISDLDDLSTNRVIEWLLYLGKKFVRLSSSNVLFLQNMSITNDAIDFTFVYHDLQGDKNVLKFSDISSVWYRRSHLTVHVPTTEDFHPSILSYFKVECSTIMNYVHKLLNTKKNINSMLDNKLDKLSMLHAAVSIGLNVPNTFISSSKKFFEKLITSDGKFITKAINRPYVEIESFHVGGHTNRVNKSDLQNISEEMYPTMIQDNLNKLFEVRSFYLHDRFYSSAIFSQNDEQTKVDFRNYNKERPNRVVPYDLPEAIAKKLMRLMKLLNLNCGSIDLVVDRKKNFYFLEVNPVGQFDQVSRPCNYNIEKLIADYL